MPYIIPPIDELITHIKFKQNYKIYISCSMITSLKEKKLLYNDLETYENIISKSDNNLNFDENAFLDLLIGLHSQEVYGTTISGFSHNLNTIKNTNNYYDKMKIFSKYDIFKTK